MHALTGSLSNTITVPLATQAEYSTDEDEFNGCDRVKVRLYDQARNPDKVPVKRRNTAYRNLSTTVPASRAHQGYNLAYFNLWWSRMGVEARKEERLRLSIVEEESRKTRRKRKLKLRTTKRLPVNGIEIENSVESIQIETCRLENFSGVGPSFLKGETVEGEGEREVPRNSAINEQTQNSDDAIIERYLIRDTDAECEPFVS